MAMGDDKRVRNQIDYQKNIAQDNLNNLRTRSTDQMWPMFHDQFKDAQKTQMTDYGDLMGGFKGFANTGGFTPMGLSNIRNRALAPSRGIMQNAQRNISRNRALQGGYSPGYQSAMSRIQRDTGQQISDAATGTEANIAQMVQQGKLAGLQGGSNLYGQTPGMWNMAGNQLLNQFGQQMGIEDQQQRLGLGVMNAQQQAATLPGKWEHTVGRIGDVMDIGSRMINPWQNALPGGKTK